MVLIIEAFFPEIFKKRRLLSPDPQKRWQNGQNTEKIGFFDKNEDLQILEANLGAKGGR